MRGLSGNVFALGFRADRATKDNEEKFDNNVVNDEV